MFKHGHARWPRNIDVEFVKTGNTEYVIVPLTRGMYSKLDRDSYEKYGKMKWCAHGRSDGFYAVRYGLNVNGKRVLIYLHREILGLSVGDSREGDHRFHNTLDNRRYIAGKENLRIASGQDNRHNKRRYKNNLSGYKGVSKTKSGRWLARIRVNGVLVHLGVFDTPELAFQAYCKAAKKYFGKFACFG